MTHYDLAFWGLVFFGFSIFTHMIKGAAETSGKKFSPLTALLVYLPGLVSTTLTAWLCISIVTNG